MEKTTSVNWNTDNTITKQQIGNSLRSIKNFTYPHTWHRSKLEDQDKLSQGIILTKLIPKKMAKNNKQSKNGKNKSVATPQQSQQRIQQEQKYQNSNNYPRLQEESWSKNQSWKKVDSNHKIVNRQNAIETILTKLHSKKMVATANQQTNTKMQNNKFWRGGWKQKVHNPQ